MCVTCEKIGILKINEIQYIIFFFSIIIFFFQPTAILKISSFQLEKIVNKKEKTGKNKNKQKKILFVLQLVIEYIRINYKNVNC